VQGVVPRPDIATVLQEGFVALASDADDPEEPVLGLADRLQDATMLPFVIFTDAEGRFLEGSSGFVDPSAFRATLGRLTEE